MGKLSWQSGAKTPQVTPYREDFLGETQKVAALGEKQLQRTEQEAGFIEDFFGLARAVQDGMDFVT